MKQVLARTRLVLALVIAAGAMSGAPPHAVASAPQNPQVVNVSDITATIVWDTATSEIGSVAFGPACGTLTGNGGPDTGNGNVHVVTPSELSPDTSYTFAITSGGQTAACSSFKTVPTAQPGPLTTPVIAYGSAMKGSSCTTPITSGIATARASRTGAASLPNEVAVNDQNSGAPGTYSVAVYPAPSSDASAYFSAQANDTISVTVDTGQGFQTVSTTAWNGIDPTIQMPPVCIHSATSALVSHATSTRLGRWIVFHWRVADPSAVIGFNLFAASHRLNTHLLAVHAAPVYSFRAHWNGTGPFVLRILLRGGQQVSVPFT